MESSKSIIIDVEKIMQEQKCKPGDSVTMVIDAFDGCLPKLNYPDPSSFKIQIFGENIMDKNETPTQDEIDRVKAYEKQQRFLKVQTELEKVYKDSGNGGLTWDGIEIDTRFSKQALLGLVCQTLNEKMEGPKVPTPMGPVLTKL